MKTTEWEAELKRLSVPLRRYAPLLVFAFLVVLILILGLGLKENAGPAIAGITALAIAFIAYPWQKSRDRDLQISLERRALYGKLLAAMNMWYLHVRRRKPVEGLDEIERAFDEHCSIAVTYSSQSVMQGCRDFIAEMRSYERLMYEETGAASAADDFEAREGALREKIRRIRHGVFKAVRADVLEKEPAMAESELAAFEPKEAVAHESWRKPAVKKDDTI